MLKLGKILIIPVILALVMIPACIDGFDLSDDESNEGLELIEEVWQIIKDDYVDSDQLDDQELAEAAINGLIYSLDDPYTSYLSPERNLQESTELEGGFSGIGVVITMEEGFLTVVAPIDGSPADESGIKPGDRIVEVDGESTIGMTLVEATLVIRGKEGTEVVLKVQHLDEEIPVEITIVRAQITVPSVSHEIIEDSIAHVKISNFSDTTSTDFETSLLEFITVGVDGIILDLRDNPGGLVNAAVSVAGQFIDGGVVVYALDNKDKRTEWNAGAGGLALDIPLVVLVNDFSASASEVVSGALQDYERALVIGTTTYGKGYMQHVQDLSNGGSLHVVFARWYTPDGRQIQDEGIVPDIVIEITEEDLENEHDPQLEGAIEYLKRGA